MIARTKQAAESIPPCTGLRADSAGTVPGFCHVGCSLPAPRPAYGKLHMKSVYPLRVPSYAEDPGRDHNFDNHSYSDAHLAHAVLGLVQCDEWSRILDLGRIYTGSPKRLRRQYT